MMKEKYVSAFMEVAHTFANLSSAKRLQVGAVIVKDNRVISIGYNGMPSGWDNNCEEEIKWPNGVVVALKTKPEVLHAESNAIAKLAKSTESGDGATLFVTHSPCLQCAKLVYQSGINSVFYRESYRDDSGIEFLKKAGVKVEQV
jgi:dCMP deaminase